MRLEFADVSCRKAENERLAEITFVDPEGNYFFDRDTIVELTRLVETQGPRFKSILLKSENSKIFSRGFDPAQFNFETKSLDDVAFGMRLGQKLVNTMQGSSAKLVAKVEGLCVGAGFEFALACHQIDFGRFARVQFPEFKDGWVTGYGGIFLFAKRYQLPGGIQKIIAGDVIRASALQPRDPSRSDVLADRTLGGISHSADIAGIIEAQDLESSQRYAIQAFLSCIKRKYPEKFRGE